MAGHSTQMIKGFKAEGAISRRRIVKLGAADSGVVLGAAVGDFLIGVSTEIDSAIGEPCDVVLSGIVDVEYGGAVTRGALLTSDATGRAVSAAPAAGVNNRIIGIAMVSGVLGDIGSTLLAQGSVQG